MSFLNITDPIKREQLVNEFLKTKRNIQLNNMTERLGDIEMKREFTKVFSPITESQQKAVEATQKAIANIAQAIPKQLAIESPSHPVLTQILPTIGSTAANYLRTYLGKKTGDTKYGIYSKGDKFYIGNKEVKIDDNDIIVGENKFTGTPGLWELITSNNPQNYSEDDKRNYANILYATNAMYVDYDPSKRPSSSTGTKWKNIVGELYKKRPLSITEITPPSSQSSDPNELVKRFALLLSSKQAGNTGVNNEMMDITNQLYKLKIIDDDEYQTMFKQAS